jgi:hypothetical protein
VNGDEGGVRQVVGSNGRATAGPQKSGSSDVADLPPMRKLFTAPGQQRSAVR